MSNSMLQKMVDNTEYMIRLIGQRVQYQNASYEVTDILPEETFKSLPYIKATIPLEAIYSPGTL